MSTPVSPSPVAVNDIMTALHTLGAGDDTNPDSGRARVLLETQTPAVLIPVILPLWETEMKAYRKRNEQFDAILMVAVLMMILSALARGFGTVPRTASLILMVFTYLPLILSTFFRKRRDLTPLHKGLLQLTTLRPNAAFVPLLVDALSLTSSTVPVEKEQIRYLLTRYLPVWCEQDRADLSPAQQKTLLRDITQVTGGGSIWTRPVGAPLSDMTLADADFAVAAIAALRRCQVSVSETRRALARLPAPVTESDPRHEIHRAAETLLIGNQR